MTQRLAILAGPRLLVEEPSDFFHRDAASRLIVARISNLLTARALKLPCAAERAFPLATAKTEHGQGKGDKITIKLLHSYAISDAFK